MVSSRACVTRGGCDGLPSFVWALLSGKLCMMVCTYMLLQMKAESVQVDITMQYPTLWYTSRVDAVTFSKTNVLFC